MPDLYVVIHEYPTARGDLSYGVASSLWPDRDAAKDALMYHQGIQEDDGERGAEGRYFVARCTEEPDDA